MACHAAAPCERQANASRPFVTSAAFDLTIVTLSIANKDKRRIRRPASFKTRRAERLRVCNGSRRPELDRIVATRSAAVLQTLSSATECDGLPSPQRGQAILTIALELMMAVIDNPVANVALPTIAKDLNVSPALAI
jgi:hypothetical protein